MARQVPAGLLVVNERVVRQALDGAPPGTGIAKGVPRRQQVRVLLVELVLEPAKGPPCPGWPGPACVPPVHRSPPRRSPPCPGTRPRTAGDRCRSGPGRRGRLV